MTQHMEPPTRPSSGEPRTLRYHSTAGAKPMSAGRVMQIGAIALLVGALLNADSLYATASRQPFGWERTVSRGIVSPFRAISHVFHLNAPRSTIERAIGQPPIPDSGVHHGISRKPTPVAKGVGPPVARLRVPTPAKPLRVWVGGDSMTQVFGQSMVAKLSDRPTFSPVLDYRISTGLTRPDYFDWPAELSDNVLPTKPEIMVVMFGANDAQGMQIPAGVFQVKDPEWQAEYRSRVAATMDLLGGSGRLIIWVGQPYMRDPGFNGRMAILNNIYSTEAAKRPWVRFFDSRPVLAAPGSTGYDPYLPDSSGQLQLARQPDGIHLSRFGGDRLADAVIKVIDAELAKAGH